MHSTLSPASFWSLRFWYQDCSTALMRSRVKLIRSLPLRSAHISLPRPCWCSRARHDASRLRRSCFSSWHRRDRVAHRSRDRRAPRGCRIHVPHDGELGRQYRLQDAARARRPGRSPPNPSPALYGTHLALGFGFMALFAASGFLAQGRSAKPLAPILWAATAAAAPLAILIALYYRISLRPLDPFAALALLIAALFAFAAELSPSASRAPARRRRPRSSLPARLRRSRSHSPLRSKRLAHGRARPDGAGRRLDCREASAAVAAWLCGVLVALVMAAHRLGAAHRRPTSAPRRSSTGSSTATAFRRSRSGSRATCCASAPTIPRRAWSKPLRSCSPCSPRSCKSATTSIGATSITRPRTCRARAAGLRRPGARDRAGAAARAHAFGRAQRGRADRRRALRWSQSCSGWSCWKTRC